MKPKIRFKKFESKWEYKLFSETFEILKNNSLSRSELSDHGRVKNVHYGDILIKFEECLELVSIDLPFIKDEIVAKKLLQRCPLKNGDVVFADAAEDNTVGKCSEIVTAGNESVVSGLHTIPCRPKFDFAERYLGYFLNSPSFHDQLLPHIQGTKVSSISRKAMTNTNIYYPSDTQEQKDLSKFFKFLNFLISTSTSRLASLKQIKAASLQSMFPQEGETIPRIRFKGFCGKWKETEFGALLKECFDKSTVENEDILLSSAISGIYLNSELFGHQRGASNIGYRKIKKNMLILSAQNLHLGNANVNLRFEHGLVSPAYKIYDLIDIFPSFMHQWIKRDVTKKRFLNATTAGASVCRKNIVWNDLYKQTLFIPSYNEQIKIASYFNNLDRQITLQTLRLEKLKQIKVACLDKMFV